MSAVKGTMRIYDAITIVGLLVLVAWTPVYWAQADVERETTGGVSFQPPEVQYGDRIDYEVIFQERNAPVVTSGPIVTLSYRPPDKGEGPEGTILVEERVTRAANIDLGPARYVADERIEHRYYSTQRELLGIRSVDHHVGPEDEEQPPIIGAPGDPIAVESERRRSNDFGLSGYSLLRPDKPVKYRPASAYEVIKDLVWIPGKEETEPDPEARPAVMGTQGPTPEEQETAPFAAMHRDRVLYGKMPTEDWWGPRNLSEAGGVWVRPEGTLRLGFRQLDLEVQWKGDLTIEGPMRRWTWWTADIPVQAGEHVSFHDKSGAHTTHSLDLVPYRYIPGDEPVPFREPDPTDTTPETPIGNLDNAALTFRDPAAIFGDTSLADLHSLLTGAGAPDSVRQQMQGDPLLAGLAWQIRSEQTDVLVAVVNGGSLRAAHITIGSETTVNDICGGPTSVAGRTIIARCEDQPNHYLVRPTGPMQGVADEVAFMRDAHYERHGPMTGRETGAYHPTVLRELGPHEGSGISIIKAFKGWFQIDVVEPDSFVGEHSEARFTLVTAGSDERLMFEERRISDNREVLGANLEPQEATAASLPKMIRPLGPEPAYGGLALVVLGLLIRFVAGVKSGAHLPIAAAFYAKISKDKALDHEHREAIHQIISNDPGVTIEEIVELVDLSRTGAFHHLETLVKNDLLKVTTIGRMRHYFPLDFADPNERLRLAVARHQEWDMVLRVVEARPGVALGDLVATLDRSKTSVSRVGSRLASIGLLQKERVGRKVRYRPARIAPDDHSSLKPRSPSPPTG